MEKCGEVLAEVIVVTPTAGSGADTVSLMSMASRWRGGVVAAVITVMATAHGRGHASLLLALVSATVTGAFYAGLQFTALGNSGLTGMWRQQMTWDVYRDRTWELHETELAAEAEQMRRVEARVADFAATYGLRRITLAVTGTRFGWAGAARSIRSSQTLGHIELGHFWFFPEGAASLPHIVEHELAHIRRNDSVRSVLWASVVAAGSVACAGLLPLPYAAAAIAVLFIVRPAAGWWAELACDTFAARQCGRTAALRVVTQFLDDRRALPPRHRYVSMAVALRSHPPLLLRRWWIRHAPALPAMEEAASIASWGLGPRSPGTARPSPDRAAPARPRSRSAPATPSARSPRTRACVMS
ncbi:hypothetical protein [Streptomyces cinereoruber]|uniref:hypothetical protein n=1 Tax=Streptomyces cinereoruber TaxID=67260 RepID=UPI00363F5784